MKKKTAGTSPRKIFKHLRLQIKKIFFLSVIFAAIFGMSFCNKLLSGNITNGVKISFPPAEYSPEGTEENAVIKLLQLVMGHELSGVNQGFSFRVNPWLLGTAFTRYLTGLDLSNPDSILGAEIAALSFFNLPVFSNDPGKSKPPGPGDKDPGEDSSGEDDRPSPAGEAVILIYHNHGTESFYPTSGIYFSENTEETVVALGKMLAVMLEKDYKIPVMHHQNLYDLPRSTAYEKARPAVNKIIDENPQIVMVVDLHRDGVARELTTVTLEGVDVAKILFVVGSGYNGWEKNFSVNLLIQQELEKLSPGLSKGIRRQPFIYNQDLHPHSILVEVGGHLNSLEEAQRTIPYLAEAIARVYRVLSR